MKKIPLNCIFQKHHDCLNITLQSFLNYMDSIIFTSFIGIENVLYPFFLSEILFHREFCVHECVEIFNIERKWVV